MPNALSNILIGGFAYIFGGILVSSLQKDCGEQIAAQYGIYIPGAILISIVSWQLFFGTKS